MLCKPEITCTQSQSQLKKITKKINGHIYLNERVYGQIQIPGPITY